MMRILHTSDWHLGRQLHGVNLLDDQRYQLEQLLTLLASQSIDVLIVAGDIYDRAIPSAQAVSLLDEILHRILTELRIPVILIAGNHDSAERLAFGARQLESSQLYIVTQLSTTLAPIIIDGKEGPVAFYPLPYAEPIQVRHQFNTDVVTPDQAMAFLTAKIVEQAHPTRPKVLIAHCFIDGGESSDSERPLSLGGSECVSPEHFHAFNYVALGHLHGRQFKGQQQIRYSGSLLKYSFSEHQQIKSVTQVDLDAKGQIEIQQIPLKPKRDLRVLEGSLETLLEQGASDPNRDDYLLCRLTDRHAILDPIGKLRSIYPNILHLERPDFMVRESFRAPTQPQLKQGALSLFADFFQQIQGQELDDTHRAVIAYHLEQIHSARED